MVRGLFCADCIGIFTKRESLPGTRVICNARVCDQALEKLPRLEFLDLHGVQNVCAPAALQFLRVRMLSHHDYINKERPIQIAASKP